jgi:hypothetical protein
LGSFGAERELPEIAWYLFLWTAALPLAFSGRCMKVVHIAVQFVHMGHFGTA